MQERLSQLPEQHRRIIKLAWVPSHVMAIFSYLHRQLSLKAVLPEDPHEIPMVARQLIKLGDVSNRLRLESVLLQPKGPTQVQVIRGDRCCTLQENDLTVELMAAVDNVLQSLFTPKELPRIIENFAFQSATLATLQTTTQHMLQTTDTNNALYIMLSGLTSGYSLGFNRAALFTYEQHENCFAGAKAIGPYDGTEAHKIWEDIEYNARSIEELIEESSQQNFDTRFQQFIQTLRLTPSEDAEDEIGLVMAQATPLLFSRIPHNPGLARLVQNREYVLAVLRPHGKTLGLIFVDNLFNNAPISNQQLKHLGFFVDQTALVWENLQLLHSVATLARYDSLTDLFNRREFENRFDDERARCERAGRNCALLIIDVDNFKTVNDTRGHQAGDQVLRQLGVLLKRELRSHDIIGRLGGDEFAICCAELDAQQLAAAVTRIGQSAKAQDISLSIGSATWPQDCADLQQLFAVADANLYRAKDSGRGCACLGEEDPISF